MSTYRNVRDAPIKVLSLLRCWGETKREYYGIRDRYRSESAVLMRSAYFIYLNRFCFNGVFRTNKNGVFNVPRGSRTGSLPDVEAMLTTSRLLRNAELVTADFEETLAMAGPGDFVYLDPPYAKGTRSSFEYGVGAFGTQDLDRLFRSLDKLDRRGAKFLLSYSYDEQIWNQSRTRWVCEVVDVDRHVAGFKKYRRSVRELLISNLKHTQLC